MSVSCLQVIVFFGAFGQHTAIPAGIGVPWVLTVTPKCLDAEAGVVLKSSVLDVVGEMCCRDHSVRC